MSERGSEIGTGRRLLLVLFLLLAGRMGYCRERALAPVPREIGSSHFTVTIDGKATNVLHAAVNLYFLSFEAGKHRWITVTAPTENFWAKGVEIQPWRLGIRPSVQGRTIRFKLEGSAKITISRPGDYLGEAEMLYLFADPVEKKPPVTGRPGLRYFGPGVHTENIDAQTGDTIYLAPGAVVFGSLNVWGVEHVRVFGRGVLVYDGPQNPADDDGWMHKKNWHCIVMDHAQDITVEGITCVVRSRTWQIQMKDSRGILFDNVKVIGANAGNANADGMDWLGGGDTIVRNSFFRAADDIFAMQTSWEGYGTKAFSVRGSPVTNITVENSVLSTSISNVVRAGWPEKNFEGGNFRMRDTDVLHMGMGGCGVPFALMEFWADPGGRGVSSGFHFENIRLEDWYSLTQLRQPSPGIREVTFTDIAGLEMPSLVPSVVSGDVGGVAFDNVVDGGKLVTTEGDVPVERRQGAMASSVENTGPRVHIVSTEGLMQPGQRVRFEAVPEGLSSQEYEYAWTFGDGTHARGRKVTHRFADTGGTLRDGSGRFRVLLHVSSPGDRHTWLYRPVIVSDALLPALRDTGYEAGVRSHYSELDAGGSGAEKETAAISATFGLSMRRRQENYRVSFEGVVAAPVDGTYRFVVIANEAASLIIDDRLEGDAPRPFPQVCGLAGNAARAITVYAPLAKGRHRLRVSETHTTGVDDFHLLWQVPGGSLQPVSGDVLFHE